MFPMAQSGFLPLSIPCAEKLANPNRRVLRTLRSPVSIVASIAGNNGAPFTAQKAVHTSRIASPETSYSSISSIPLISTLRLRPSPELGLISVLFVLSTVIGAFFSLALISIPAMLVLRSCGVAVSRLEKVASEEVPGMLVSVRLSGMEINDLTQLVGKIRRAITGAGSESSLKNPRE